MSGPDLRRLWDRAPYRIEFLDGGSEDLVIALSSVGHDPSRPPSPEFVRTVGGRRALFVMDASRSWASDPGFESALRAAFAAVSAAAPVRRVVALGLSMGGFSALAAAQIIPVDVVLAFGPQYSIMPRVVPGEDRWSEWTARLTACRWPTAPLPARGWTCLFHGGRDDLPQALRFPVQAGVDQLIFPDLGHSDLMGHLKAKGVSAGLLEAALAGDRRRLLRISGSAGGVQRKSVPAWT